MSKVTNLIFSFAGYEDEVKRMEEVNRFPNNGRGLNLVSADADTVPRGWYGGSKFLEVPLYIGAINHLALEEFVDYLRSIEWVSPEYVQVIVKEQDDDKFKIIEL